jgi:hypothetical protein|tara:strand:+ start:6414 stop:7352 length:939 start_codon:yes stop_codon:yes gene_type:complete
MDKLRKVGLTALAGTFAIGSAQALEMSASGSAGFTYSSSDDDEVTGERFSFGDSITLSGSGETDMGWTVTASYELDDGNTPYDDQTVSIDTGNGTFFIQTNADKGGHNRLVPNVYGSASYSLANGVGTETGKHLADGVTGTTNLAYTNSDIAGFDVGLAISPGAVGGTDTVVKVKKADLTDGLTVAASIGTINPNDENNDSDELTLSASYAVGGVTVGYTHTSIDQSKASSSDIDATHVGISFSVNDDLSVSMDRSTADNAQKSVDEETTSYQVAYTMGSMSIKAHVTKTDNVGYSSTATDENKAVAVSFSF